MCVRSGTESDIDAIVEMACEFWTHTGFEEEACSESIKTMVEHCISISLMSVVEIDNEIVGFAAGVKSPLLGNNSVFCGSELAWWVNPGHRGGINGIKLFKHLEGLAKDAGIKYWVMAYMESSMPEAIKGIYEKMGYVQSEVSYMRVL